MWHEKTKAFTSVHPPTARWKVQRAGYQWDQTGVSHAARLLFMSLLIIPTEKANKFVKYVNCLLGPSEDGRASSAGGKKNIFGVAYTVRSLDAPEHQSGSKEANGSNDFVMSCENKPGGSQKKDVLD